MSGDINCKSNFVSYVLADVIIFVYEVSFIFWHYINVDLYYYMRNYCNLIGLEQ